MLIQIGQNLTSVDCKKIYTCVESGKVPTERSQNCDVNALCQPNANAEQECICKDGYIANGTSCRPGYILKEKTSLFQKYSINFL